MTKVKTPFLSMGASGTVGGSLTAQKRGSATLLREKPIPTDPYSLNQAYHRWDYRDYAYRWTLLTDAQKQTYRTNASRYHITGFNLWMRESLKDLPNLLARWRLDEPGGAIAHDSSNNDNHGTIYGATPALGAISRARSFDGVNDYIYFGNNPLVMPDLFTLECFLKYDGTGTWKGLVSWRINSTRPGLLIKAVTTPLLYLGSSNYRYFQNSPVNIYDNEWHHIAILVPGKYQNAILSSQMFADGIEQTPAGTTAAGSQTDKVALFLARASTYTNFSADHLALHSLLLTQTELLSHSQRRYPPQ